MRIELSHRVHELPVPLRNARGTWTQRESLLIRLIDSDGVEGWGEASPLPGHSPDDIDLCERELSCARLPSDITSSAARFALETALLDLEARRSGRSAAEVLGAAPDASLPLSALVDGRAIPSGFCTYKAKIDGSRPLPAEMDRLLTLRRSLPADTELRLDANGSLPPAQLTDWLDALAELRPEFLEEPVPAAMLSTLARSPVPLALDESLVSTRRFEPLVERGLVRVLVLKPMLLGGIRCCQRLADSAKHAGAKVVVSHLWDGPIGLASSAVLALALAPQSLAAGLAPHAALPAWPRHTLDAFDGTKLRMSTTPGLGVRWDAT
jgi:o-succinylbenzoate synthase